MTELEQVEERVLKLTPSDFEEYRKWFREQEWHAWAEQSHHVVQIFEPLDAIFCEASFGCSHTNLAR